MVRLEELSAKDVPGAQDEHNLPHSERTPNPGDTGYAETSNDADEHECGSSTQVGDEEVMDSRLAGKAVPSSSKSEEVHLPLVGDFPSTDVVRLPKRGGG